MIKRHNVQEAVSKMCPDIEKRMKADPVMGTVMDYMIHKVADLYNMCEDWEVKANTAVREKDAFKEALSKYSQDGPREVTSTEKALEDVLATTQDMMKAIEVGDVEYQEHLVHVLKKKIRGDRILNERTKLLPED